MLRGAACPGLPERPEQQRRRDEDVLVVEQQLPHEGSLPVPPLAPPGRGVRRVGSGGCLRTVLLALLHGLCEREERRRVQGGERSGVPTMQTLRLVLLVSLLLLALVAIPSTPRAAAGDPQAPVRAAPVKPRPVDLVICLDTSGSMEGLIDAARRTFQVDVAKSCHHGSADFSPLFLRATNPVATVISSGDDEPYSHPRADALGTIGRFSRSDRPMIFSTELARSVKETIKHPHVLREKAKELARKIDEAATPAAKERAQARYDKFITKTIDRSVAVFGTIHLRSDGERVLIAQKLERPRSKSKKWDLYRLERAGAGPLRLEKD